jgi:hypothetical protein
LHEVERQCLADDPKFTRSFDKRAQRLQREGLATSTKIAIAVAVVLGALMLIAGSLGGALASAVLTGLIWLIWRHANDSHRQST